MELFECNAKVIVEDDLPMGIEIWLDIWRCQIIFRVMRIDFFQRILNITNTSAS